MEIHLLWLKRSVEDQAGGVGGAWQGVTTPADVP